MPVFKRGGRHGVRSNASGRKPVGRVQEKLQGFLEKALEAWSRVELEPNDWMGSKTICDMVLALAWNQRRLGMSGRGAFELAAKVARQLSELEHEVTFCI